MPAWLPPAIMAGSQILGKFLGGAQQKKNIKRTNQANLRLAEMAHDRNMELAQFGYDKDLEMWKMQNEYNSPASQMQRFEDAGLNKHMIYGQGTPGNATGMPSFNQPQYSPPTLDYRGTPNPTADALGEFIGTAGDIMDLKIGSQELDKREQEAGLAKFNKIIRSMDIPGANLQYMIDSQKEQALKRLSNRPQEFEEYINNEVLATLTEGQTQRLGETLKNEYQSIVNQLAEQGITLGDKMLLRVLTLFLNGMGYNIGTLNQ